MGDVTRKSPHGDDAKETGVRDVPHHVHSCPALFLTEQVHGGGTTTRKPSMKEVNANIMFDLKRKIKMSVKTNVKKNREHEREKTANEIAISRNGQNADNLGWGYFSLLCGGSPFDDKTKDTESQQKTCLQQQPSEVSELKDDNNKRD